MSDSPSMLRRILSLLLVLSILVLIVAYPIAFAIDRTAGREVVILSAAFDETPVRDNRDQFDDSIQDAAKKREAIVEIYGSTPTIETSRVLFVDDAELVRPAEEP